MGETWWMTDYPRIQFENTSSGLLKKTYLGGKR